MKFLILILFIFISSILCSQNTSIPDPNFEQALINLGYDIGPIDGIVPTANINTVTNLSVFSKNISDLTGIEDFTALTFLNCKTNSISNLNLSTLTSLDYLDCASNNLVTLDLSNNTALTFLRCSSNSLTNLNVLNNTLLTYIAYNNNSLNTVDLSNNTLLTQIWGGYNPMTTLDVSNNTNLTDLSFEYCSLTSIDLSNNIVLTDLRCWRNALVSLDVSNNQLLESLECGYNALTTLDVSNNAGLWQLNCFYNSISFLDLTNNGNLIHLQCYNNQLVELFIPNSTSMITVFCYNNLLTSLDLSNTSVNNLRCNNNSLTRLDLRTGSNNTIFRMISNNNPNLYCIAVDDPWSSTLNWTNPTAFIKDSWTQYYGNICGNNVISGVVYYDADKNCSQNNGEIGVPNTLVSASGVNNIYVTTNDTGYYEIRVDSNTTHQLDLIILNNLNLITNDTCPTGGYLINSGPNGNSSTNNDFGLDIEPCSFLSLEVGHYLMRRCFRVDATITYKNEGPIIETNAEIFVDFPEHIIFLSASKNYVVVDSINNIYKFNIDTIHEFSEEVINIVDSIVCNNPDIAGYTQCIRAWITPKSTCTELKDTTLWDKSDIQVNSEVQCMGDSVVVFQILNRGTGNMLAPRDYRFYYDNQLAYTSTFQLLASDTLTLTASADGSTIRLEADQDSFHPGNSIPRKTIEGCAAITPLSASLGFWTQSLDDDLDYHVSEKCMIIRNPIDPNIKTVSPEGITNNNYVSHNSPLEYVIYFQNSGNDTAITVLIVDTLSGYLDLTTFNSNGASHSYNYQIMGSDTPVLVFTFNNIMLPDSNIDEPNSHGYVSFSISPLTGLAPFTTIDNVANIYFDFNSAIVTDTASVTLLDTTIISPNSIIVTELNGVIGIEEIRNVNIKLFPNPSNNHIFISGLNEDFTNINIYNFLGKLILHEKLTHSNLQKINITTLPVGIYFINLENTSKKSYTYKLIKQ